MIALLLVALGAGGQLAGLAEADRVHLVVLRDDAAATCPDEDELAARVRARLGSEPFLDDDDTSSVLEHRAGRELRVGVARDGSSLEARVVLFSPAGTRLGRRTLRGDLDCVRLADDLVLAMAIAIDPLLLVRRRPAPPPSETATPMQEAPGEPTASESLVEEGPVVPVAPIVRRRARSALELPAPVSIVGRGVLLATAGIGVIAAPTIRGEVSFDYGVLDIDVGARLDLPARYPIEETGGAALLDLTLVTAQLAPCLGWTWDIMTARGCGVVEGGALVSQGVGFVRDRSVTTPWVALGARAALDFRIWPTFGLVLTGDLSAPLVRPRFVDEVSGAVYAQPGPVVGSLGLGLELQIR